MRPLRRQRLILVIFIVEFSALAAGLLTYALRENINLFYPPGKIAAGEVPLNTRIRGSVCVKPDSIVRASDILQVSFVITDGLGEAPVSYTGIIPALFAEGEAGVVNGMLDSQGVFQASQVLAKHDENYMPPEVADAMKGIGEHQATCKEIDYGA